MFRKVRRLSRQFADDCYNALFNPPIGRVLMLHRIGSIDNDRLEAIEGLKVSEERLQQYIDKNRDECDFISLDELYTRFVKKDKGRRPFICITFDDGFKDNYSIGLPFFERNKIPFSVFITTRFINRNPPFNFPFILERIIRENEKLTLSGIDYICRTREQKNETFRQLKEVVLNLPYSSFENSFKDLFQNYLLVEYYEDLMMSWDDVRSLSTSPLCTIGSHTLSHCRLSNLSEDELVQEIRESKHELEMEIGQPVRYISYPFGWVNDINDQVFDVAKHSGYSMGFISYGGPIRNQDADLFRIKRIMFTEN